MNFINTKLFILTSCEEVLGSSMLELLQYFFDIFKYAVPLIVMVLIMVDFAKAVLAGSEDQIKKAQSTAVKRLVLGVALFLLPTLIDFLLGLIGIGTCGIGFIG